MSFRTPFSRFVVDMEARPDGRLAPRTDAAWVHEPARDERRLHRRLGLLADATPVRVAAFASKYGLLRLRSPAWVPPERKLREHLVRNAAEIADDLHAVSDWYDKGMISPAPRHATTLIAVAAAIASLPYQVRAAFRDVLDGREPSLTGFDAGRGLSLVVTEFLRGHLITPAQGDADVSESTALLARFAGVIAGWEDAPLALAAAGGPAPILRELLATHPEFVGGIRVEIPDAHVTGEWLATAPTETIEDWLWAAERFRQLVELMDAIHAAEREPVDEPRASILRGRSFDLLAWQGPRSLRPAEVATRVRPILTARIQGDLEEAGFWPIRTGSTAGTYWRALHWLHREFTGERPPRTCTVEGCTASVGTRSNRLYCDDHRRERSRAQVARSRRRAARAA